MAKKKKKTKKKKKKKERKYKQMASKHMKGYSTSYIIREMKIRTTVRYHHIPIRMAKMQNSDDTKG